MTGETLRGMDMNEESKSGCHKKKYVEAQMPKGVVTGSTDQFQNK